MLDPYLPAYSRVSYPLNDDGEKDITTIKIQKDKRETAYLWCLEHFGNPYTSVDKSGLWSAYFVTNEFYFNDEQDALLFSLACQ